MKFLKRLIGNKSIVTIIAGIACVVILAVAYRYRVNQKINAVSVPYAKVQINSREQVTDDKIGTVKVASSMITDNVVKNINNVKGKYVNYNTMIPAGSLFYSSALVEWSAMPDSAWSNIANDNTIVSLSVNTRTTYGNSIYPEDKIDIYYQNYDSNGKLIIGKLIEGIQVLAVKDTKGTHIFKKSAAQKTAAALIFAVPEDYHLLLRKAKYVGGDLIPVLRNANYNPETNISSTYLKEFILSQTMDIQPDAIEDNTNEDITVIE